MKKSDLEKFHKQMPLSKVTSEYAQQILDLGKDEMGHFTLSKEDKNVKTGTLKQRLLRAGKAVGKKVVVKRYGTDVVFWIEPDAEPEVKEPKKIKK